MQGEDRTGVQHPRVLVIEDDQSVRRMLRFSLRDAGFVITEVATGSEALQALQTQAPEAVILDLGLPDGLGGAVLDWLRRHNGASSSDSVWVVVSALDQTDIVNQYGQLGSHFLPKPFNPWELVTRLQDLLRARQGPDSGNKEL